MFRKVLGAIRYVRRRGDARDLVSHARFAEADLALRDALSAFKVVRPTTPTWIEDELLTVQIAFGIGDGPQALAAAQAAALLLIEGHERYTAADRDYLINYCQALIWACECWRDGEGATPWPFASRLHFGGVSKRLRRDFPLGPDGSLSRTRLDSPSEACRRA